MDLLLVNHYQFNQAEFESLLDEAVHFEFNFLCRPQWTLQEFMSENRRTVNVGEAIRKFRYCVEYTYFAELFKRYVTDRGLAEMNYEDFKALMGRIDAEVVERHSSAELARLLKPMLDFIEVGIPETPVGEKGPALPINAAVVFFEDKKLDAIRKELEVQRDRDGRTDITLAELEMIIAGTRGEEIADAVPAPAAVEVHTEAIKPAVPPAPVEAQSMPKEAGTPLPIEPDGDLEDVYSLFTVKDQKVFVRKLFNKDEIEFRNALDRLNPLRSWKEASFVLDQIYTEQNVDPFSKEAILLTEKLFSRYGDAGEEKQ
jgi:hypothetical protein